MNIKRSFFIAIFLILIMTSILPATVLAQQKNDDRKLEERIKLIKASQHLEQKKEKEAVSAVSLFMTTYHSGDKELNLGAKFESELFKNKSQSMISVAYVIEGIYLAGEDTNLAGFLSLRAALKEKLFNPYIGAGAEIMGKADYQAFVGLNLTDNFFVETKFINDKNDSDNKGDFYSAVGFKMSF
ncbi:hypothetical protein [Halanaerobium kushneri]|uniref:Uncharacterized protein n=1 Tax=Halanaerobium kushneri TaxID=56779 RepID=A0A1N6WW08_9FIRM|nr:hypothetical protein [Halanaerobium kushneri]SIQ94242.1 hypothetical protein SAMN05421834_11081 [Halanaerobium kushneri]